MRSLKKQKPFLAILDVGHGSAAVLHDEGGTVVFDTGKGAHVARHLDQVGIRRIQAMMLSHADDDHIGGAVTLLLNKSLRVDEVLLNSDASKDTVVFEQLRLALADANARSGTKIARRLTTSVKLSRRGASIEVLHPPDIAALSGVMATSKGGKRHNSNSMSAAIRITRRSKSSILLGGDIESDCLDEWKKNGVRPIADVLVFPHHGGLPGTSDENAAASFASQIIDLVKPEFVIFSNHKTKFGNPRECILKAISKAGSKIRFACTQLPVQYHPLVKPNGQWSLHSQTKGAGVVEGSIFLLFRGSGIQFSFSNP